MSEPTLTAEQQQALEAGHGFVQGSSFVLMSLEVFRNTLGAGSEAELSQTLAAIEEGLTDIAAGRVLPLDEARRRLDEKYGVSH
jgi:hypothetical protein